MPLLEFCEDTCEEEQVVTICWDGGTSPSFTVLPAVRYQLIPEPCRMFTTLSFNQSLSAQTVSPARHGRMAARNLQIFNQFVGVIVK